MIVRGVLRRAAAGFVVAGCVLLALPFSGRAAEPAAGGEPATPDFSAYQRLLDQYLVVTSAPGAPLETGFRYDTLFVQLDRNARLEVVRRQFLAVPPSRMSHAARTAWAINFYNFLVIETVTYHFYMGVNSQVQARAYMVRGKTASIQDIRLPKGKVFETPVVDIEGQSYSLDRFERHFLFGDFDRNARTPPPETLDPRLHFAIVCAAKGCPTLMPRAYHPDSLDSQLDFAVRNSLAHPRHLRWVPERSVLLGSSIFSWYAADFGGTRGNIGFVKRYAPAEIASLIEERKIPWLGGFLPWDWSYNLAPPNLVVGAGGGQRQSP